MTKTRNKFKIMGLALILVMLLSLFVIFSITASAAANITVTIDTGASVTLKDINSDGIYEIANADELYAFAAAVNGGNGDIKGELTQNIAVNPGSFDESGVYIAANGESVREWIPIGAYNFDNLEGMERRFYGEFYGNGYTVSGLYYNNSAREYMGLFGVVEVETIIQNVGVVNTYFEGYMQVGGIAASTDGVIENCFFDGVINGDSSLAGIVGNASSTSSIINCLNLGAITASSDSVGGIVASCQGKVYNCLNLGVISSGETDYFGAISSFDEGDIKNCFYLEGTSIGGIDRKDIEGKAEPVTANALASGEVAYILNGSTASSTSAWRQKIGTDLYPVLSGEIVYKVTCVDKTAYSNISGNRTTHNWNKGLCLVCGESCKTHVWESECVCGVCGMTCGIDIAHVWGINGICATCSAACNHEWDSATCFAPKTCEVCKMTEGTVSDHSYTETGSCIYCDQNEPCEGEGTATSPYRIANQGNLYWFANQVIQGDTDACALLISDVVISNAEELSWTPMGTDSAKYVGTFNGNNKSIKGLYIDLGTNGSVGFFSNIGDKGVVKNLSLVDIYVEGRQSIGGIAGHNYGRIENCYVSGVVYATTQIAGGIAGGNLYSGVIVGCRNEASVSVNSINGMGDWAGGIVGVNYGLIDRCVNLGTISSDTLIGGIVGILRGISVTNCLNLGTVIGSKQVGGIVGFNNMAMTVEYNGYIENCLNLGEIIGEEYASPICGAIEDQNALRNCYYLEREGDTQEGALAKNIAQLQSGEVAYLLGTAWGMDLSDEDSSIAPNGMPVYRNQLGGCTESTFVYEYSNEQKNAVFTHRDADQNHLCDDGCGERVSECVDISPKDHKCDMCSVSAGDAHEAAKGKHSCNYCGEVVSLCESSVDDGDCTTGINCLVCGAEMISANEAHIDANNDGKCDACKMAVPIDPSTNTDSEAETDSDTSIETNTEANTEAESEVSSDTNMDEEFEIESEVNSDTDSDINYETNVGAGEDEENTEISDIESSEPDSDATSSNDGEEGKKGEALSTGAVIGIVIGSIVAVSCGGLALFWFVIKKKSLSDLLAVFKK